MRGLDYYTRTVFEVFSSASKQALNSGGRYDYLAEILGGKPTPGIGFATSFERLYLELKHQKITPPLEARPCAYVVYFGKSAEMKDAAIQMVAELRHAGIKTEMGYGDRSAKSQMKQANTSGSAYAVLIGEDEMAGGYVTVQDLRADKDVALEAKQVKVQRDALIDYLQKAYLFQS